MNNCSTAPHTFRAIHGYDLAIMLGKETDIRMFDRPPHFSITRTFRDVQSDLIAERDEHGFIVHSRSSLHIEDLLTKSAVLVRAAPWTGKTHVANELYRHLSSAETDCFAELTALDAHTIGRPLKPAQCEKWITTSGSRLVWIIDSIDEGEVIQRNVHTLIIDHIKELTHDARIRLTVLMFVRAAAVPEGLCDSLAEIFRDGFANVELLPLDRPNAERIVGQQQLADTLETIARFSLQAVACYPAALKCISTRPATTSLSDVAVWRGVLSELLSERRIAARRFRSHEALDDQFRAAAHIAVVMTFANVSRVHDGTAPGGSERDIADLFPTGGLKVNAARAAITSAMFRDGRFVQKNIREWMCAFGLADVRIPRLKPLVTTTDGRPSAKHLGVLSLLHKTTAHKGEVGNWICEINGGVPPPSDVILTLREALAIVDRLESIADTTEWNIAMWGDWGLLHLSVPGIGIELARRLGDDSRSANRRELLLQIALTINAGEAIPVASEILRDENANEELRQAALGLVIRIGNLDDLQRLESFVRDYRPTTRVTKAIVSAIMCRYLDAGIWSTADCAKHAPFPESDVIDSTHVLGQKMEERMSIESARILVGRQLPELLRVDASTSPLPYVDLQYHRSLLRAAITVLDSQAAISDDDAKLLIPILLNHTHSDVVPDSLLTSAFARNEAARRMLYEEECLRQWGTDTDKRNRYYRYILTPDDVDWLTTKVASWRQTDVSVLEDVLSLAANARSSAKRNARNVVRRLNPALVSLFDKRRRRWLRDERRHREASRTAREQPAYRQISCVVDTVIGDESLDIAEKARRLAHVCLTDDQERPREISGTWNDLSESCKHTVLDICEEAIRKCKSTPIPDGPRFSLRNLQEAWCFQGVVMKRAGRLNLTPQIIREWLPPIFLVTLSDGWKVVAACHLADEVSTEHVFVEWFKREMRSGSADLFLAKNLDQELWSAALANEAAKLVADAQYADVARAEMLRILTSRSPDAVRGVIDDILRGPRDTELWRAAIDSFVRIDSTSAWPMFREYYERDKRECLLNMRCLYDDRHAFTPVDICEWAAEQLLDLARILHVECPRNVDPEWGGVVTPVHKLVDLRNRIPQLLFRRRADGDRQALAHLVAEQPYLTPWYSRVCAQERAEDVLSVSSGEDRDESELPVCLPCEEVVRLAESVVYRIVRSASDLLEVVEEEIRAIGGSAGRHIEMLYLPYEVAGGTKRRREAALQAYYECRLSDRLPGRVLQESTEVSVHRESQQYYRERTDIVIEAPTIVSGRQKVVIEVKWSDNDEIATGLADQLGEKYLKPGFANHGIYLVGWNGKLGSWKKGAGVRPNSVHSLEDALRRQAAEYMKGRSNVAITPIVIDLEWPRGN